MQYAGYTSSLKQAHVALRGRGRYTRGLPSAARCGGVSVGEFLRLILVAMVFLVPSFAARAAERPNLLFIFADDWGYGDLGCYGHAELKTPNLDRFAGESTRFTQFYVTSGVCSPSRCSVITGHFPARHRVHGHFAAGDVNARRGMPNWLDPSVVSLPRLLGQSGYKTAHFGKWHLGGGGLPHGDLSAPQPRQYGYDETRVWNGNGPTWNGTRLWPATRYMDDDRAWVPASSELAVDATIDFIARHRDEPFFVNLWLKDPHEPLWPTDRQRQPYRDAFENPKQCYYAVLTDADRHVGRLLDGLDELGLRDNTLVIFSSDNGPENLNDTTRAGSTGGLKGRKRSLHEGGVRVPLIVRWPGKTPSGRTDDSSVLSTVDLLPTFCHLAGAKLPADFVPDGENVADAFLAKPFKRTKPLYWEWRFARANGDNWPAWAVRTGDWKLLLSEKPRRVELYRIPDDPGEQNNLADRHPAVVQRLVSQLMEWKAGLPQ